MDLMWNLALPGAVEAALARRFPFKLPGSRKAAVPHIVEAVLCAHRSLAVGAKGALFDLTSFYREIGLRLPDPLDHEMDRLAIVALSGARESRGQGALSPLEAHRRALRKRLRFACVKAVMEAGRAQREECDPAKGAVAMGADPNIFADWRRTWPEASEATMRACALAIHLLPKDVEAPGMVQPRAMYDAWLEVADAKDWPGIFYLPSQETCERLGWEEGLHLLREYAATDAPCLGVP